MNNIIPVQLHTQKFILVRDNKAPLEKNWQMDDGANYFIDDPKLINNFNAANRYGVLCGFNNLIVVDFDNEAVMKAVLEEGILPKTFSVRTAGKELLHLYYRTDNTASWKVLDKDKNTIADIQGRTKQVIGPGSKMPNGREYIVVDNIDIATVPATLIHKALDKFDFKRNMELLQRTSNELTSEHFRKNYGADDSIKKIKEQLKTKDLLQEAGITVTKNPTSCPFHSSKGGKCFGFIEDTGVWHCFHCDEKGDAITLYMMLHKLDFVEAKKQLCTKFNIVYELQPTSNYPATSSYKARSWGFLEKNGPNGILFVEQISPNKYVFACKEGKGIATVMEEREDPNNKKSKMLKFLIIRDTRYNMPTNIKAGYDFYKVPNISRVEGYLDQSYKPRHISLIIKDLKNILDVLFDFTAPNRDITILILSIIQSYVKAALNAFFFIGIDATKGAGKTTLLEITTFVMRHGFMAGDISASSLPRLVEELDLTIGIDELDQRIGQFSELDTISILRKGQRRGNPYIRLNKNTLEPEKFDVAGGHLFSFRGELEDAFMSRTVKIPTAISGDKQLPIINLYKQTLLAELRDELFFWMLDNIVDITGRVVALESELGQLNTDLSSSSELYEGLADTLAKVQYRAALYAKILEQFTPTEIEVIDCLLGRNVELGFLLINLCKIIGIDFTEILKTTLKEKQIEDDAGEGFYKEILEEYLVERYEELRSNNTIYNWCLKDGLHQGSYYYTKSEVFIGFNSRLKNRNMPMIGYKKFASLLRDIGFVENISIMSQRPIKKTGTGYDTPRQCIIFTKEILKALNIGVPGSN